MRSKIYHEFNEFDDPSEPERRAGDFSVTVRNVARAYFPHVELVTSDYLLSNKYVNEAIAEQFEEMGDSIMAEHYRRRSDRFDQLSATQAQEIVTARGDPKIIGSPRFRGFLAKHAARSGGRVIKDTGVHDNTVSEDAPDFLKEDAKKFPYIRDVVFKFPSK